LSHDLASIDDVIRYRDNIDLLPESAVKHIEETWANLRNNYQEVINASKRIRYTLDTVCYERERRCSIKRCLVFSYF